MCFQIFRQRTQDDPEQKDLDGQSDQVLGDPGHEQAIKTFAHQNGQPQRVEQYIDDKIGQRFGNDAAPDCDFVFIETKSVQDAAQDRVQSEAEEERARWFDDETDDVADTAHQTGADRSIEHA